MSDLRVEAQTVLRNRIAGKTVPGVWQPSDLRDFDAWGPAGNARSETKPSATPQSGPDGLAGRPSRDSRLKLGKRCRKRVRRELFRTLKTGYEAQSRVAPDIQRCGRLCSVKVAKHNLFAIQQDVTRDTCN
jgi:hypothetical protein